VFNRNRGLRRVAAIASISLVAGCSAFSDGNSDDKGPDRRGDHQRPSTLDPAASWTAPGSCSATSTRRSSPTRRVRPRPSRTPPRAAGSRTVRNTNVPRETPLGHESSPTGTPSTPRPSSTPSTGSGRSTCRAVPRPARQPWTAYRCSATREVLFHLNKPDATFPFVLATPAMSIVDPTTNPANSLRKDGKVSGSGPYALKSYDDGKQANSSGTTTTRASPTARTAR